MLIVVKVLLAPVLVALCTLIAHRWGASMGGWILGLPLISGPVSVLLFLEHGEWFARSAAAGTLLGLVAAMAFYTSYLLVSQRRPWWVSLSAGIVACGATAAALAEIHPGFEWSAAMAFAALVVLAGVASRQDADAQPKPTSPWTLVARMVVAGAVVFVVTAGSGLLGASISGLLAPLPIIAATMASWTHHASGCEVAGSLLRGSLAGSWGGVAFFTVVGVMMAPGHALETYVVATLAALLTAAGAATVPLAMPRVRRLALAVFAG